MAVDQVSSAKIVREEYIRSDLEVENVDWKAAALYLALTVDRQELVREGIAHLVPRRKDGRGRRPTVKSPKMSGPLPRTERLEGRKEELEDVEWEAEDQLQIGARLDQDPQDTEPDSRWVDVREPVSKEERKKVFAKVLEVAIKATFKNHIYTYKNELYRQNKGGAIGLRLTGVVARIVMDRWARLLKEALEKAEVPVHMLEKYVDDVNLVTSLIEPGSGYSREKESL